MLIGTWRNIEELEDSLNLEELQAVISAEREKEHRRNKFMAALKGIDIDKDSKGSGMSKFEEVQQRVRARMTGKSEDELEMDMFGLDVEIEE